MIAYKLRIFLIAVIPLLFSIQSCNNNPQVKTDNGGSKSTATSQATEVKIEKKEEVAKSPTPIPQPENEQKSVSSPPVSLKDFDRDRSNKFTDSAKFLAGIKVDEKSPLAAYQKSKAWNDHSYYFESAWKKLEQQQLSKIRKWTNTELKSINQTARTIFYPFSGPDFLYAHLFFPKGTEYVMVGLEPIGNILDITKIPAAHQIDGKLQEINKSMNDILQLSFFRTKAMKVDLAEKGVLPILFVFLARTNHRILDVQYFKLNKDASIQLLKNNKNNSKGEVLGLKIDFVSEGETLVRNLYYFPLDLSNDGLQKTPEFKQFIKNLNKPVTYLKAASYLMHNDEFSEIRNLILSQSTNLLQDDSGMPIKYFDRAKWNLKFYGSYTQPIDLFKVRYQPDLRKIYQSDPTIKPLNFGIGYQFEVNTSNLMLASRKEQ
ncbi:MAG: hypothetical protein N3E45_09965 [Oscillatoriaceae bacterium SKW80]|nr:hypothetical protein [Oscillatoriaceae bacterium SKYG93]MCX8121141.1 hypothetical protein [Oscillatoriaceae bacterium SKW80]MDW8453529.1 hypothetical protein [Oscillatoriaceae cyanobacterium SKYGB_i_bin93]HIK26879.1 hypothetical protein [Oscillatoriaceae cyanobacterium M7585_C2015_266]